MGIKASRYVTQTLVISASPAAVNPVIWVAPFGCKVIAVKGYRVGGTGAVINAQKKAPGVAAVDLATDKSLTSADTWMSATLGTAAVRKLAAGDALMAEVVSVAGSPTALTIQIDLVVDADVR